MSCPTTGANFENGITQSLHLEKFKNAELHRWARTQASIVACGIWKELVRWITDLKKKGVQFARRKINALSEYRFEEKLHCFKLSSKVIE